MPKSFENKKAIRVIVTLGKGSFNDAGENQIELIGYRCAIDVDRIGGVQLGTLQARIYGVRASDMDAICTIQTRSDYNRPAFIEVYAVDGAQDTMVFMGNIVNAWGVYEAMPDVYLMIHAVSGMYQTLKPVPPRSFNGVTDVASAIRQIIETAGMKFENSGVDAKVRSPYLPGTAIEQAKRLAEHAGVAWYSDNDVFGIIAPGYSRGGSAFVCSTETGMIRYPVIDGAGVRVLHLYHPGAVFLGRMDVISDIKQASGQWLIVTVGVRLESERPNGAWHMILRGQLLDGNTRI